MYFIKYYTNIIKYKYGLSPLKRQLFINNFYLYLYYSVRNVTFVINNLDSIAKGGSSRATFFYSVFLE